MIKKRVLCICEAGVNRSTCLCEWLKNVGHDAVAAGWRPNAGFTLDLLSGWADRIVVMEPYMKEKIEEKNRYKVMVCDVGADFYGTPKHPDLVTLVKNWAARVGLRPCCGASGPKTACNLDKDHFGKHAHHTDSGTVSTWQ